MNMGITLTEALNYKSSRLKWIVEPKNYEEMIELGKAAAVIDILQREFRELMGRMRELEEENADLRKQIAGYKEYARELQEEIQDFIDRG